MRRTVTLLLLACVAVRWADAACGCAEHNGWVTLIAEVVGSAEHADHASDAPAYEHDCCSGGRATYTAEARVIVSSTSDLLRAFFAPEPEMAMTGGQGVIGWSPFDRPPLSRAALQVWRI